MRQFIYAIHHETLQLRRFVDIDVIEIGVAGQIEIAEFAFESRRRTGHLSETVALIEIDEAFDIAGHDQRLGHVECHRESDRDILLRQKIGDLNDGVGAQ